MVNPTASSNRDSSSDSFDPSASRADNGDKEIDNSAGREEVKIYKTISRVHRACNACRKQKARCDGPENPPCRRCRQVGIECIFEKPPKEAAPSSSAAPDTSASADRIRVLESQMTGMQSMISELVASIKANTNAITAPPSQSPRASSASHSMDQNLTPSDGPTAGGDDGEMRETDISNDQLSAPIEALRGLADAAAAAAESEGHTSNDSSDEKTEADNTIARSKQGGESSSAPSLQLVDEGGKRTKFAQQLDDSSETSSKTPRKKRRRDTNGESPNSAALSGAGLDGQGGTVGSNASASAAGNAGANAASPSGGSRSGRMDAPGLVSGAPGDLVTLGLVNESDAIRLFETFQKGVPKFISIFHLEDESMTTEEAYHYVRTTSYFLFNVMLAIGAKVECGGKSPSRLYQTCMAQAKRNAKDTMFSPVAGKAAVQAMVLLAAYSENGWLPLGLSIRMAQELGLDRSFQKLMSALPASGYVRHPQPPPPPKHLTFYHNSPSSHYTGSPGDVNSVGGDSVDGKIGGPASATGANAVAANAAASGDADAAARRELDELKDLARGSRLWFFLFLFDHQASYGAGRPAMLSKHYVRNCRAFLKLNYPLTVKTDARFISTLELLIIRETHYDAMAPYDQPVDARMLSKMRKVTEELNEWHQYWSSDFESRGYGQDSFFQQSLVLQCASAELYLSCTALRGIRDANDADQMGPEQKELIIQATRAADTCLSISVNSKEYREMLGWAPHYTHVTAAFACVFLIKIARLFPRQVDTYGIFSNAERLASRLAEVPASKYARVIRILLAQAWKKIADLSPAIGLYAALGAEATRPGAITPAEIKTGGPSDSGISLLYKLLQDYQNGQGEGEGAGGEGGAQNASNNEGANGGAGDAFGGTGSGSRTPGFSDLINSGKWLTAGISSPSVGNTGTLASASGTFSPNKAGPGMPSHRGSIAGIDYSNITSGPGDNFQWSSFLGAHTPYDGSNPTSHQPIQLPLWMQESTGGADMASFDEKPSPAPRSWGQQDQYKSPLPHPPGQYASPNYPMQQPLMPPHHRHSNSLGVPPSPLQHQPPQQAQGGTAQGGPAGGMQGFGGTNFDSVLSDLGLPLDGLDGLFGEVPINAPTGQSNYSV
uniref:Zn(2)-C6 fungal-type domain-containing protein n=1 Tax=Kalmanozyma brasiliensis (strain GHG001) TaxID=1365824 RepID=V5F023_KALBG